MNKTDKHLFFERIIWDSSITPTEIEAVFAGKKNKAGFYDKYALFRRMLESYPWFTLIEIFTKEQLIELLSEEVIQKIRSVSLRHQYEFARKKLQKII